MIGILLLTLLCGTVYSAGINRKPTWGYIGANGPDNWWKYFAECSGSQQSPININTSQVHHVSWLKPFEFTNYPVPSGSPNKLLNDGHTAVLALSDDWIISGSNLRGLYKAHSVSFHWGQKDNRGSEHTFDNSRYAMEIQLVFFAKIYDSFELAASHPGGLAIISVFVEADHNDNPLFDPITAALPKVPVVGQTTPIYNFRLIDILPVEHFSRYFHYSGSMTTPPCFESVQWYLMKERISISHKQLEAFRGLKLGAVEPATTGDNFRQLQHLNNREVFYTEELMHSSLSSQPIEHRIRKRATFKFSSKPRPRYSMFSFSRRTPTKSASVFALNHQHSPAHAPAVTTRSRQRSSLWDTTKHVRSFGGRRTTVEQKHRTSLSRSRPSLSMRTAGSGRSRPVISKHHQRFGAIKSPRRPPSSLLKQPRTYKQNTRHSFTPPKDRISQKAQQKQSMSWSQKGIWSSDIRRRTTDKPKHAKSRTVEQRSSIRDFPELFPAKSKLDRTLSSGKILRQHTKSSKQRAPMRDLWMEAAAKRPKQHRTPEKVKENRIVTSPSGRIPSFQSLSALLPPPPLPPSKLGRVDLNKSFRSKFKDLTPTRKLSKIAQANVFKATDTSASKYQSKKDKQQIDKNTISSAKKLDFGSTPSMQFVVAPRVKVAKIDKMHTNEHKQPITPSASGAIEVDKLPAVPNVQWVSRSNIHPPTRSAHFPTVDKIANPQSTSIQEIAKSEMLERAKMNKKSSKQQMANLAKSLHKKKGSVVFSVPNEDKPSFSGSRGVSFNPSQADMPSASIVLQPSSSWRSRPQTSQQKLDISRHSKSRKQDAAVHKSTLRGAVVFSAPEPPQQKSNIPKAGNVSPKTMTSLKAQDLALQFKSSQENAQKQTQANSTVNTESNTVMKTKSKIATTAVKKDALKAEKKSKQNAKTNEKQHTERVTKRPSKKASKPKEILQSKTKQQIKPNAVNAILQIVEQLNKGGNTGATKGTRNVWSLLLAALVKQKKNELSRDPNKKQEFDARLRTLGEKLQTAFTTRKYRNTPTTPNPTSTPKISQKEEPIKNVLKQSLNDVIPNQASKKPVDTAEPGYDISYPQPRFHKSSRLSPIRRPSENKPVGDVINTLHFDRSFSGSSLNNPFMYRNIHEAPQDYIGMNQLDYAPKPSTKATSKPKPKKPVTPNPFGIDPRVLDYPNAVVSMTPAPEIPVEPKGPSDVYQIVETATTPPPIIIKATPNPVHRWVDPIKTPLVNANPIFSSNSVEKPFKFSATTSKKFVSNPTGSFSVSSWISPLRKASTMLNKPFVSQNAKGSAPLIPNSKDFHTSLGKHQAFTHNQRIRNFPNPAASKHLNEHPVLRPIIQTPVKRQPIARPGGSRVMIPQRKVSRPTTQHMRVNSSPKTRTHQPKFPQRSQLSTFSRQKHQQPTQTKLSTSRSQQKTLHQKALDALVPKQTSRTPLQRSSQPRFRSNSQNLFERANVGPGISNQHRLHQNSRKPQSQNSRFKLHLPKFNQRRPTQKPPLPSFLSRSKQPRTFLPRKQALLSFISPRKPYTPRSLPQRQNIFNSRPQPKKPSIQPELHKTLIHRRQQMSVQHQPLLKTRHQPQPMTRLKQTHLQSSTTNRQSRNRAPTSPKQNGIHFGFGRKRMPFQSIFNHRFPPHKQSSPARPRPPPPPPQQPQRPQLQPTAKTAAHIPSPQPKANKGPQGGPVFGVHRLPYTAPPQQPQPTMRPVNHGVQPLTRNVNSSNRQSSGPSSRPSSVPSAASNIPQPPPPFFKRKRTFGTSLSIGK